MPQKQFFVFLTEAEIFAGKKALPWLYVVVVIIQGINEYQILAKWKGMIGQKCLKWENERIM